MKVNDFKEVFYDQYCVLCKYKDLDEDAEPCAECLDHPVNTHSHKPINLEEK